MDVCMSENNLHICHYFALCFEAELPYKGISQRFAIAFLYTDVLCFICFKSLLLLLPLLDSKSRKRTKGSLGIVMLKVCCLGKFSICYYIVPEQIRVGYLHNTYGFSCEGIPVAMPLDGLYPLP